MANPRKNSKESKESKETPESKSLVLVPPAWGSPLSQLAEDPLREITSFTGHHALANLAATGRGMHRLFQEQVSALELLKKVAFGEQAEAETMIRQILGTREGAKKILDLLKTKNAITDCAGWSFQESKLTPFQYAYWAMDRHMLTMLQQVLPPEERARQLEELRTNKIIYQPVLMTIDVEQKLDAQLLADLRRVSSQNQNKPIIIKQGADLLLYGYDFFAAAWKVTALDSRVFMDNKNQSLLPFPPNKPALGLLVRRSTELDAVPLGNFILIQEAPGQAPSALLFKDRFNKIQELPFAPNQNLSTFTSALYPDVRDNQFSDYARLSAEQLWACTIATHQPLSLVCPVKLTEAMYQELAREHTQGTEHGVHYDFYRLQDAYHYRLQYSETWNEEQQRDYWDNVVGAAQELTPDYVRAEFSRLDRKSFRIPTDAYGYNFRPPSFDEPHLPRKDPILGNISWYSRDSSNLFLKFIDDETKLDDNDLQLISEENNYAPILLIKDKQLSLAVNINNAWQIIDLNKEESRVFRDLLHRRVVFYSEENRQYRENPFILESQRQLLHRGDPLLTQDIYKILESHGVTLEKYGICRGVCLAGAWPGEYADGGRGGSGAARLDAPAVNLLCEDRTRFVVRQTQELLRPGARAAPG